MSISFLTSFQCVTGSGFSSCPVYFFLKGINVWALVAAMVLLSSCVNDIQYLLFCLRRPSSTVTMPDVTETLYCIAVLLYAMREKGINISNRYHPGGGDAVMPGLALAPPLSLRRDGAVEMHFLVLREYHVPVN